MNVIVFVIIVVIILRRKNRNEKISNSRKKIRKAFIVFVLALMFGIGWAFGILGLEDRTTLSICFQFLFIIFVGCQGLFIFLVYPCRSKYARNLWKKCFFYATCRCHIRLYEEQNKSVVQQRSRDQDSSSTPSRTLSDITSTKTSSLDFPPSNSSTAFINAGFLPPSPGIQDVKFAEGSKRRMSLQASVAVLDSIEEEPVRLPFPELPQSPVSTAPLGNAVETSDEDAPMSPHDQRVNAQNHLTDHPEVNKTARGHAA